MKEFLKASGIIFAWVVATFVYVALVTGGDCDILINQSKLWFYLGLIAGAFHYLVGWKLIDVIKKVK